ncbi:MAG: hypothetical protein PF549_04900 [Patescibacteria group bacterium]|nr:hypothetical protein [Patescibacteria group bacterium]
MKNVTNKFDSPVNLTKGSFKNLEIVFKDEDVNIFHDGVNLKEFSFVWLSSTWTTRDLAYAIHLYLEHHKIPYTYAEKGTSKITDHITFALAGIPSPATIFLGTKNLEKKLELIKKTCGYPLVIKDTKGAKGTHSELVENEKEFLEKLAMLPRHKNYLFQKFIPNEYDWGILIANGVVVAGEKRYPEKGEFRNNICNGAKEVFVDINKIPEEIKQMAIKISTKLGLSWSRSDIIIHKETQKPYLMEINRFPGITTATAEIDGAYTFLSSQINALKGIKTNT